MGSAPLSAAQRLASALRLLQAGQPQQADALLAPLMPAMGGDPDYLNIAAAVALQLKRSDQAIDLWRRSLAARPDQLRISISLGHALRAKGDVHTARGVFEDALGAAPQDADALFGLGLVTQAIGDFPAALSAFERAAAASGRHAGVREALGALLTQLGRPQDGLAQLDAALRLNPASTTLPHNRGVAFEALRRDREAGEAFSEAVRRLPRQPASWFGLANVRRRAGDMAGAVSAYRQAVAIAPSFLEAHEALNETLWQAGHEGYLSSYVAALRQAPQDAALRGAYARQLSRIRNYDEAGQEVAEALRLAPDESSLMDVLGQCLIGQKRPGEAAEAFAAALRRAPDDARLSGRLAEAYMLSGEPSKARDVLSRTLASAPHDQENLALMSVALRLLGDTPACRFLCDYGQLVQSLDVEPPEGYESITSFHDELAPYLVAQHITQRHPTDQTLRGGTQTLGALFEDPHPLIQRLREQLAKAVARYIAQLPKDSRHPFLSRAADAFDFSGSWSVRLGKGGFHTNHIHPRGWISSAYYVRLPQVVAASSERQGWFKLGETNPDTCPALPAEEWIRPSEGRLILFPSYFWHGTHPFAEGEQRLTVAFDVLPR